jgi:hypothetical protein
MVRLIKNEYDVNFGRELKSSTISDIDFGVDEKGLNLGIHTRGAMFKQLRTQYGNPISDINDVINGINIMDNEDSYVITINNFHDEPETEIEYIKVQDKSPTLTNYLIRRLDALEKILREHKLME